MLPDALALLAAGLLLLAPASLAGARAARLCKLACAVLCALGLALALACLAAGSGTVALPVGPAGIALEIGPDPLAACCLAALFVLGLASAGFALHAPTGGEAPDGAFLLPCALGGLVLAVASADRFGLILGLGLALLPSGWTAPGRGRAVLGVGCVAAATLLLGPEHGFAALRAHPPEGWRAAALPFLVCAGLGALAWVPARQAAAPGPLAAVTAGAAPLLVCYLGGRLLLDLPGPAAAAWWSLPALALGLSWALLAAFRSLKADLGELAGIWAAVDAGLCLAALGAALAARAADLPVLTGAALGAALLQAGLGGSGKTLLVLCAAAVGQGAGSRSLARLGGLARAMPLTAACTVVGAACMTLTPPGPGFAAPWLLLQSLFALPRLYESGAMRLAAVLAVAAAALTLGISGVAAARLAGIGLLGRPRTPRAAAAEEVGGPARWALAGLAGLLVVAGLLPGLLLRGAAGVIGALAGSGSAGRFGWLGIAAGADAPGYAPLPIAFLLAALAGAAFLLLRRLSPAAARRGPAWEDGFAAPPPWLPFGDPATEIDPASAAAPLRAAILGLLPARAAVALPRPGARLMRATLRLAAPGLAGMLAMAGAGLLGLLAGIALWEAS